MLLNLPSEIIHHIFSFITIDECESMLEQVQPDSRIYHIFKQTIYGRTLLYLNNRHCSLQPESTMSKLLFKYVDAQELGGVCEDLVIPDRFVLSYHYNRSQVEDEQHDDFLDKFMPIFQHQHFFNKINNIEMSIDLFNKKFQSNELTNLKGILCSDSLQNNLSYLNLNKFQRFKQDSLSEFFDWLGANLYKFKALHTLTLTSNNITSIDNWRFPESLINLNLSNNKLVSVPQKDFFPSSLIKLNLSCNNLTMRDASLPDGLQYLDVQLNNISKLSNIQFPSNLKVLIASGNNIMLENDEVVKFPEQLCYLSLLRNPYLNNVKALKLNKQLTNVYVDATFQGTANDEAITYV